jgi:hypothetical protein
MVHQRGINWGLQGVYSNVVLYAGLRFCSVVGAVRR